MCVVHAWVRARKSYPSWLILGQFWKLWAFWNGIHSRIQWHVLSLCSRFIFVVLQAQCQKNWRFFKEKGKSSNLLPPAAFLRFETLCRGANWHPLCRGVNRHPLCRDTEDSWWFDSSLAEAKYLESDDFLIELFVCIYATRLVTLSYASSHCMQISLHSNPTILIILIADFGQDLTRTIVYYLLHVVQARCPMPDHPPCQIIPHARSSPMPDHPPSASTECFSTRES